MKTNMHRYSYTYNNKCINIKQAKIKLNIEKAVKISIELNVEYK